MVIAVRFAAVELNFGVFVAEKHLQHILQATTD